MKKSILSIVLATLCLFFSNSLPAQTALIGQTQIKPLQIGDKIPDTVWNKQFRAINHPQGKETISLNDYGDKLIILDFWASYCHPCIASLDYLDSIKNDFNNQLVILPVQVYDSPERGIPFMKKKGWIWPSITSDTTLNKVLLINFLSGFGIAFIKDGRLLAVPGKKQLTKANIANVLKGEPIIFQNRINKTLLRKQQLKTK